MARKLLKCSKVNPGGMSFCMFTRLEIEKGAGGYTRPVVPEYNCKLCLGDIYNLLPSVSLDKDGELAWHQYDNPDPEEKAGTRMFQYEALTPHNTTGDEYHLESELSIDQLMKKVRSGAPSRSRVFAEIHPCYHMVEFNVPRNRYGKLDDAEPVTIGGNGTFIVSDRWVEDRFGEPKKAIGKQRVEDCYGIYGTYDFRKNMMIHKYMRDYGNEIPGWVNYTTVRINYNPRLYNIHTSKMDDIKSFILENVKNPVVVDRIIEAYNLLKSSKTPTIRNESLHIDIWRLMSNNGLNRDIIRKLTKAISTKGPKHPFISSTGNRVNLEKLRNLYLALRPKRRYKHQVKKGYSDVLLMAAMEARGYMANIVNCLLNDPVLATINPEIESLRNVSPYSSKRVHSSRKYWYAIEIIDLAFKDGILSNANLPNWVRVLFKRHLRNKESFEHVQNTFCDVEDYSDGKNGVYDDYIDALSMGLMEPYQLFPAMTSMKALLEPKNYELNGFYVFTDMCRAIKSITPSELKFAWEHFKIAWGQNNPSEWWYFIKDIQVTTKYNDQISLNTSENGFNFATDLESVGVDEDSWEVHISNTECLCWDISNTNSTSMVEDEDCWLEDAVETLVDESDPSILEEYSMGEQGESNLAEYANDVDYEFLHMPSIEKLQRKVDQDIVDRMGE